MFKNKGFLYGLGLGLILGASLLQLMNFSILDAKVLPGTSVQPVSAAPSISTSIAHTIAPFASIEPFASIPATKPTETTNTPATPSSTPAATPIVTKAEKPATPTPAATFEAPANRTIIIKKGMPSSEVARLLFNKGIITDEKAFDKSLGELNVDRIIRVGTFTFLPNEDDEAIINKITTRK